MKVFVVVVLSLLAAVEARRERRALRPYEAAVKRQALETPATTRPDCGVCPPDNAGVACKAGQKAAPVITDKACGCKIYKCFWVECTTPPRTAPPCPACQHAELTDDCGCPQWECLQTKCPEKAGNCNECQVPKSSVDACGCLEETCGPLVPPPSNCTACGRCQQCTQGPFGPAHCDIVEEFCGPKDCDLNPFKPNCTECEDLIPSEDVCACPKYVCEPKPQPKDKCGICEECEICQEVFQGPKSCNLKARSCVKGCPKDVKKPECGPCEVMDLEIDECGCTVPKCRPLKAPDADCTKCARCEICADKPFGPPECELTQKVCVKECPALEEKFCGSCQEPKVVINLCGCEEMICVDPKTPECGHCEEHVPEQNDNCSRIDLVCKPKLCPRPADTDCFNEVNITDCGCPVYMKKECGVVPTGRCPEGWRSVSGFDKCKCPHQVCEICDLQGLVCNPKCQKKEVAIVMGCPIESCKTFCPEPSVECRPCEDIVFEVSECGCKIAKCMKRRCKPTQEVTCVGTNGGEVPAYETVDDCGCVTKKCPDKQCEENCDNYCEEILKPRAACDVNPCQNGAVCHLKGQEPFYYCECPEGQNCEEVTVEATGSIRP